LPEAASRGPRELFDEKSSRFIPKGIAAFCQALFPSLYHIAEHGKCGRTAEPVSHIQDINPDRIRFEVTPQGKVAHLLKRW